MNLEWIGYLAGATHIFSFLPQVVKTFRLPNLSGLSIWLFLLMGTSALLWVAYGIVYQRISLSIANSVIVLLNILIIVQILRWKKKIS